MWDDTSHFESTVIYFEGLILYLFFLGDEHQFKFYICLFNDITWLVLWERDETEQGYMYPKCKISCIFLYNIRETWFLSEKKKKNYTIKIKITVTKVKKKLVKSQ